MFNPFASHAAGSRVPDRARRLRRLRLQQRGRQPPHHRNRCGWRQSAGGTIAVITVDPSNPYWKAEVDTAKSEATKLGYKTHSVDAHSNDADKQNQFIDGSDQQEGQGRSILDPAGADESVGAVQKATDAGHPGVPRQRRDQPRQGVAKSQIVSNNAQGATLGAEEWAKSVHGEKGQYVELFGNPTDNNAQVRSDGYPAEVLSQYPDLKRVQKETANWDRARRARPRWRSCREAPRRPRRGRGERRDGLGCDPRAERQGQARKVKVLGFDGNQDAVNAVK